MKIGDAARRLPQPNSCSTKDRWQSRQRAARGEARRRTRQRPRNKNRSPRPSGNQRPNGTRFISSFEIVLPVSGLVVLISDPVALEESQLVPECSAWTSCSVSGRWRAALTRISGRSDRLITLALDIEPVNPARQTRDFNASRTVGHARALALESGRSRDDHDIGNSSPLRRRPRPRDLAPRPTQISTLRSLSGEPARQRQSRCGSSLGSRRST